MPMAAPLEPVISTTETETQNRPILEARFLTEEEKRMSTTNIIPNNNPNLEAWVV
jgi:hypothetical protein